MSTFTVHLIEYKGKEKLVESSQVINTCFSFAYEDKNSLIQFVPWMKCRDYLQDIVMGQLLNRSFTVHGLTFSPQKEFKDPTEWKLLVRAENYHQAARLRSGLFCLKTCLAYHNINLKIPPLEEEPPNILIITLDPKIYHHPAILSLITLCIRSGVYRSSYSSIKQLLAAINTLDLPESSVAQGVSLDLVDTLLAKSNDFINHYKALYSKWSDIYQFHSNVGIRACSYHYNETKSYTYGVVSGTN